MGVAREYPAVVNAEFKKYHKALCGLLRVKPNVEESKIGEEE